MILGTGFECGSVYVRQDVMMMGGALCSERTDTQAGK